nr:hypothetical protein [Tanacetum cinerariifolium]
LTEAQQLQDYYDVQATNIILHGLPPDVYTLVNHQETDKVKLLMKGTELSYQERECILYNLFDKFASVEGETLYEYYWRFSQLINDMHTIRMTMQQVQVNTKFLNALPPKWSKFVTDEVRVMRKRYLDPLALVANSQTLYNPSQSLQHSVPTMHPPAQQFTSVYAAPIHHQQHHTHVNLQQSVSSQPFVSLSQEEDLIDCIIKAMAFLSAVASRFSPSNNQLRMSSNPRNQTIPQNSAFQTKDLDAYDSDCDDISSAKAFLMENLPSQKAFWLKRMNYNPDTSVKSYTPVRIEAPSELPKDNFRENQNGLTFNQLFEINELKAQSQENDMVIRKLKDRIKYLSRKDSVENVKKDIDKIETINIELEQMAKLLTENENLRKEREHLKSIYKDQFDLIRKTHVQSNEHCASLIDQINEKSVANSDLNAQLQEKIFPIVALKNKLRKLKGKNVVEIAVSKTSATIAPGMFKLDITYFS